MAEIPCKQCGHVNESERVYCHNCGNKLDRALLEEQVEPPAKTREQERLRIKRLTNPPRINWKQEFSNLVLMLIWSVVAAALILIASPPDAVPPMPKERVIDAPQLAFAMQDLLEAPTAQRTAVPEDAINSYLKNLIKAKEAGLGGTVKFERVFVHLEEAVCRITVQRSFMDFPLYGSVSYRLGIAGGKIQATNLGGSLGRLNLSPRVMSYLGGMNTDLWEAVKREHKLLDQMAQVEVHKGQIILQTSPANRQASL